MNRLYHGRLKKFWLQHAVQCTMLESAVLTWPSACCASNCTLLAALTCFFHSRYVRAATLLSISQARKWFPSLKSPVISTWPSKESALLGVFVDVSVARGQLRPPRYGCCGCLRMNCIRTRGIKLSLRTCQSLNLSVLPLHANLPWKVLVVSNHALLKSFLQRKKQSLPESRRATACSCTRRIDRRSIDGSGSANRKGPGATRRRRSLPIAAHVDSFHGFRSTPAPNCRPRDKQLARLTSLSFVRVGNESRF